MSYENFQTQAELIALNQAILQAATERAATLSQQSFANRSFAVPQERAQFIPSPNHHASVSQIQSDLMHQLAKNSLFNGTDPVQVLNNPITNSISNILLNQISDSNHYLSEIEQAILRATEPLQINETEEISVLGERGIWANRSEVINWRGELPINSYPINEDSNPDVITKKSSQQLDYIQELAIRYLRPPTPPAPGEIIINQMPNEVVSPAPPLIIRQQPLRPATPEPLVIREAPPQPPPQVGRKVITISGKKIPPPPRKVVIERLAPLPAKPQAVLIERWLPYEETKRKVIFNRSSQADPVVVKPRNVIVQWEAPQVNVKKEYRYLGVVRANPFEYVERYGSTLRQSNELPQFVTDIKTPEGITLAANYTPRNIHELYGDVSALNYVDLEREGLSEYRQYLQSGVNFGYPQIPQDDYNNQLELNVNDLIDQIFRSVDRDHNGRIKVDEAEKLVLKLNSRLGRRHSDDDVKAIFSALHNDGTLNLEEFRKAFLTIANC